MASCMSARTHNAQSLFSAAVSGIRYGRALITAARTLTTATHGNDNVLVTRMDKSKSANSSRAARRKGPHPNPHHVFP